MKLKSIILTLLLIPCLLMAQEEEKTLKPEFQKGHEIKIGWGLYPINRTLFLDGDCCPYYQNPWENYSIGDGLYNGSNYFGSRNNFGSFNLSYVYRFTKRFELGATFSLSGYKRNEYKHSTGELVDTRAYYVFGLTPTARLNYFVGKTVKLYGSLSCGLSLDSDSNPFINFNLNYFGISVGRKVYWYLDLSVGNLGVVSTGLGIKI